MTLEEAHEINLREREDGKVQRAQLVLVDDASLRRLNARPTFLSYQKQLWQRRHFIFVGAKHSALSKGRDSYLGKLWLILDPVLQVAIYAVVFGVILNVSRGIENYIGFLIIGVIFFGFFRNGLVGFSGLVQSSRRLISSFVFPRAAIVYSLAVRQSIDNAIPAALALISAVAFQYGAPLNWTLILAIPLYALMHVFIVGLGFFVSRGTAFIPDLQSLISVATRGLFFLSGVFFSISRFDAHPTLTFLVELNPIYQFLMAFRMTILWGQVPPLGTWAYLLVWSFALFLVGSVFFWQAEERYGSVK